jgi:hypothetical protein
VNPSTAPLSEHKARIVAAVRAILEASKEPVGQQALALAVGQRLDLQAAESTLRRRCKEAVGVLVMAGVPVASDARGYRIASSPEDRARGRRYLVRQVATIADRLRAYDASGGERLHQLALELAGSAQ